MPPRCIADGTGPDQPLFHESALVWLHRDANLQQDAKDSPGNLPATTEEQYGACLNKYTIKEALHDGAVLGFQVEYHNTFDMRVLAKQNNIEKWTQDDDGFGSRRRC